MTARQALAAMRTAAAAGADSHTVLDAGRRDAARSPAAAAPAPSPARTAWRAADGDVLDAIARASYGTERAFTALLAANPALADAPPHLSAGTLVGLPPVDPPAPTPRPLWQ